LINDIDRIPIDIISIRLSPSHLFPILKMKKNTICWIKTVSPETAAGELQEINQKVASPLGNVDNVYQAQSLCPKTILGHDVLYKSVLHDPNCLTPMWFLEAIAVYVSLLNKCTYAVTHHGSNLEHLMVDANKSKQALKALQNDEPQNYFEGKELALMRYARKLTLTPSEIIENDIKQLQQAGATDKEILEINQVTASFAYSNRVINGLGVDLGDEPVGFYVEDK
jgi:uncharacterized peroxidase-related enzyme